MPAVPKALPGAVVLGSSGSSYRLGKLIGSGGMAEVFHGARVAAEGFERPVAIKRIRSEYCNNAEFTRMFIDEARLCSHLRHPGIVTVEDFVRDVEGRLFLVMEWVDGPDLEEIRRHQRMPLPLALYVVDQLLAALSYAHTARSASGPLRVVHRDLSPHNVLVSWNGEVKLADFGIAHAANRATLTASGVLKGKAAYMSPEQARTLPVDGRSDLFALGIILHELVTGRRLYAAASQAEICFRLLSEVPPPPSAHAPVPAAVDELTMTLLQRNPDRRYADAVAARSALRALLGPDQPAPTASDLAAYIAPLRAARGETFGARSAREGGTPARQEVSRATAPAADAATRDDRRRVPQDSTLPALPGPRPIPQRPIPQRTRSPTRLLLPVVAAVAGLLVAISAGRVFRTPSGADPVTPLAAPQPSGTRATAPSSSGPPQEAAQALPTAPNPASPQPKLTAPAADPSEHPRTKRPRPKATAPMTSATLVFQVQPWAEVQVDGALRGITPQAIPVAPGTHQIRLRNGDLNREESWSEQVADGETRTIRRSW